MMNAFLNIRQAAALAAAVLLIALFLGGCSRSDSGNPPGGHATKPLRIGFVGNPIAAPLYVAENLQDGSHAAPAINIVQFTTSADIGYALLSGDLDAGLIEPAKAEVLLKIGENTGLKVAGEIQFPYGATVVLQKDLSLRLPELAGRKVAAKDDHCELFHQFTLDAPARGLDLKQVEIVHMPFEDMIPALEAKVVDAILTKGSYGVIAESLGHTILYQKWDLATGSDDCCPAVLAQTAYYLVVRPASDPEIAGLVQRLEAANRIKPSEARALISKRLGIAEERLIQFPVAVFSPLNDELRSHLKKHAWNAQP
ncbi:MAG TPA: hypothetical protein VLL97_10455 [Acidobacteriota bacterium]|nr:hypothetical protein [Acidobacteriota bacterium]